MADTGRIRFSIRPLRADEADSCEAIMRSLPEWFGIEEAIVSYRQDLEAMETLVADREAACIGFLTLHQHNEHSSEIQVMAVAREHHRQGVGRALVNHAERLLRSGPTEFLQVKTLGPSRENQAYAKTRLFYGSLGFRPLEENNLWGEASPCLIMVKHLECT
jgi:ribosomal protein S18 acetylase RimI-like enzyme